MFDNFIRSYNAADSKDEKYSKDLIRHIENSLNNNQPLYAVHGFCTDGGTAGAMIKYGIPESAIIPLDYGILKNNHWLDLLQELDWVGIVDLEPFNTKLVDWYVDHHLSTIGKKIIANKIRFDVDGDSGAWQLFLSSFLPALPDKIVELAVMTRITDTANYITEPPIYQVKKLKDLDLSNTEGISGQKENEQRIWLLDDAWGSVTSLKEQLELHNILATDGFMGLRKVLPRINELRKFRKKGVEIANQISLESDIVIFSFKADSIDKFGITRRLQTRGARIVISMSEYPNGYKISFRRNRNLSKEENQKIQLNKLAEKFNGGGHAGAAGGFCESYDKAIQIISDWALRNKFTFSENKLN